jgi:hypothetical protein
VGLLEEWGCAHLIPLVKPNDIVVELNKIDNLYDVLPEGWRPHLVVAIPAAGLAPYRHTTKLSCPTAYVAVDTWQCLPDYMDTLHYDFVFEAQREYIPYLEAAGSRHVFWLPLACAPKVHRRVAAAKEHDIAFVGATRALVHRERAHLLELLKRHFSVLHLKEIHGPEISEHFARGRLAFNACAVGDLNMRVFEAMAMGCVLLTNRSAGKNGLFEFFEEGKHLISYDSPEELVAQARRYLGDEQSLEAIAEAGYGEVLAKHTYGHRVQAILDTVRGLVPDFEARVEPDRRLAGSVAQYFGAAPGVVVDVGLGTRLSKHAARHAGAKRFVGLTRDVAAVRDMDISYDEILAWPGGSELQADTLIVSNLGLLGMSLDEVLHGGHELLVCGGTLILVLPREILIEAGLSMVRDRLHQWFRSRDFVMTFARGAEDEETGVRGGVLIVARKRTRTVREMAQEIIERHPIIGEAVYTPVQLAQLPEGL